MKKSDVFRMGVMWLAVVGMMLPSTVLGAPPAIGQRTFATRKVRDIALGPGGTLSGRVVDIQGRAFSNVPVQIHRGEHLVAHIVTDTGGQFSASQLAGGTYSVSTPNQQDTVRVWLAGAAPPIAARTLEMTDGQIIRGQDGACNPGCGGCGACAGAGGRVGKPWLIALGIAAAIAIPLALDDDDDDAS